MTSLSADFELEFPHETIGDYPYEGLLHLFILPLETEDMYSIIQIHTCVLWDWQYYME